MKQLFFLFLIITQAISLSAVTIETKETPIGLCWVMVDENNSFIGAINSIENKNLTVFSSSVFASIDKDQLPPEVRHIVAVIHDITTKYGLQDLVMLGDLYVAAEYRGKGYAQQLLARACRDLIEKGIQKIALIPDPFEYVEGRPVLVEDPTEYASKKQQLILFYQKNGFVVNEAEGIIYMYRNEML